MRRYIWHFGVVVAMLLTSPGWAQTSAALDVQVAAPTGDSPAGLVVVASLSVPDTPDGFLGPRAFASVTDAGGQISFSGLPFGIYSVCVEPRNQIFVEPCRWFPPDTIHLTNQNTSGTVNLTVLRGIPVDIRINDPEGLLASSAGGIGLLVGVVTPLGPVILRPGAQDSGGFNYRIIAPSSVAASIQVSAGALRIADATGSAVNFASSLSAPSFNLAPAAASQSFQYTLRKSQ
jgi:hypothetical protein